MMRLTRRRLLELGAAAGFAATLGRPAAAARAATGGAGAGAADDAPAHLRRSSYVPLVGGAFGVAGTTLTLVSVGDLDQLAGRDDAFRLELHGDPSALMTGIHPVRHSALGGFDMFVSPVGRVEAGVQRYEVVVDRSVPLPAALRQAPRPPAPAPAPSGAAVADAPARPAAPAAPRPGPARATRRRRRRDRRQAIQRRLQRRRRLRRAKRRALVGQAKTAS